MIGDSGQLLYTLLLILGIVALAMYIAGKIRRRKS
jgi:hypothetical protein